MHLVVRLLVRQGGNHHDVLAVLPVHRRRHAVVGGQLQRVDHSEDLRMTHCSMSSCCRLPQLAHRHDQRLPYQNVGVKTKLIVGPWMPAPEFREQQVPQAGPGP